ncbi:D-alanyl-D-alanine carboxypeptidase family protein [Cytobacillus gottheilii]|uniref:D-alanyl-D-alanine carboxypeptidase family protein n=1 Tax=Cytobacillus gottheilii TaxID=859144 RepID=UPI0011186DF8|nr:D-alanyl-D-alanine carboxypeptidase family protein [Cytobacillus gottheilii]
MIITFSNSVYAETESIAEEPENPEIVSEAAILMDSDTGAILYEKNAQEKMVPASLTKIATAIYAIENEELTDIVIVSESARNVVGTRVYLEAGEQVSLLKLLQGMLINSGNDAAWAIAEYTDGNIERFSEHVNEYLKEKVGVKNTHFTNPHGLYEEDHYTTAEDLALITNYAMQNETFRRIFGETELPWNGESWDTTLYTHHLMLLSQYPYEWVTGGKTGFVNEAKQTLATTASKGSLNLTAITLKADFKRDIYQDTIKMFDYGFNTYVHDVIDQNEVYQDKENKYTTNGQNIEVTVPFNNEYREELSDDGELRFFNEDGTYVQSIQLHLKPSEENISQHLKSAAPPPPEEEPSQKNWIVNSILAAGMLVMAVFGYRRIRSR